MSNNFVSLKVKKIIRETPDANTIVFEKPAGKIFDYQPGQYLTLKFDIKGEPQRRAYSLCSSPYTDDHLAVTVKRVDQGLVSNHIADQLQAGQMVDAMPPMGNFKVSLSADQSHHYVLLGGGSGITPMMSILKSVLEVEKGSKVSLIYGNRDEKSIIFRSELNDLVVSSSGRLKVIHSLNEAAADWTGLRGLLNRQMLLGICQDILNSDDLTKSFWLCGPAGMMEETEAALGFLGIGKDSIHKEAFTATKTNKEEKAEKSAPGKGKAGDYSVRILLDGEEKDVLVKESKTILEAVIDEGLDPPYACQMGVCCTCRAQVSSGLVEMEEEEGLSDSEIDDGFVLTCQSHPMSEGVVLEFK